MAVPSLPAPRRATRPSLDAWPHLGWATKPRTMFCNLKLTLCPLVSMHVEMTDHRKAEGWESRGIEGGRPKPHHKLWCSECRGVGTESEELKPRRRISWGPCLVVYCWPAAPWLVSPSFRDFLSWQNQPHALNNGNTI